MGTLSHVYTWLAKNLAANATTTIKASTGVLHAIVVNTKGASANTCTVYDNASAGSGTKIATLDTVNGAIGTILFDAEFINGLTVVIATGTAADLTFIYR